MPIRWTEAELRPNGGQDWTTTLAQHNRNLRHSPFVLPMNFMKMNYHTLTRELAVDIATEIDREEIVKRIDFLISEGVRYPFSGILYRYNCVNRPGLLRLHRIGIYRSLHPAIDISIESTGSGSHIRLTSSLRAMISSALAMAVGLVIPIVVIIVAVSISVGSYVSALLTPLSMGLLVALVVLGMRQGIVDSFNQDVRVVRWLLSTKYHR